MAALAIGLAAAAIFGVYKYQQSVINKQVSKIENLTQNVRTLEGDKLVLVATNKAMNDTIDSNNALIAIMRVSNNDLRDDIEKANAIVGDPRVESLATKKPGLIQIKVNKATFRVFSTIQSEVEAFYLEYK